MYIDTHAHYDDERFDEDRGLLLPTLHAEGIEQIINCASSLESLPKVLKLTEAYPFVYGAMGIHPHDVKDLDVDQLTTIYGYATASEKIVAIGEIGLDYHYDFSPRDQQQEWFIEQITLALELEMPVIVHSREAAADTMEIITEYGGEELRGVIHAYSGSVEMAEQYADMGYYLGIGGMVTFPDAKKLKKVVAAMPLTSLLLETDCPYLTPVPHRGKRNDSGNLQYVAEEIARIKEVSAEEVAAVCNANARRLFGLPGAV